jgi:TolB protein
LLLDPAGLEEPWEPLDGPLAGGWGGFAWSPDSTRIAYVSSGKANVLNVADGQTTTIAEDVASGIGWAPDGTHLAYSTGAGNDVVVVGADGSDRLVVASLGLNPQWMPDGQRLIFSRRQEDYPQETSGSIAMVPAAGGPVEEIASGFPLYVSSDGKLAAVGKNEDGRWEIEVFDLAAGESRVVSGQVDAWGEGSFSPDGAQLLFRSQDETSPGLYLVNVDGTGLRQLVQPSTGYAMFGRWSPDSRFVAFVVSSGGFCEG